MTDELSDEFTVWGELVSGGIQFNCWTTRKLAVITTYDGSFEDYINDFIDEIGDVFNALLAHMADAPPLPVQKNRKEFFDYVRANDLRAIEPFYSAYPKATVLDIKAALGD